MVSLRFGLASLVAVALLAAVAPAWGSTLIDTTPAWDGFTTIQPFGPPDTATYGQTVTVPAIDTRLDSFTFYMELDPAVVFRGYVYAWGGSMATGAQLFASGDRSTTDGSMQAVTFNTGGLDLTAGNQYVLFASISETGTSGRTGVWGFMFSDLYAGGEFAFINNGTDPSQWTTTPWWFGGTWDFRGDDLAFQAEFNAPNGGAVPEPVTMTSVFLAVSGLGAYLRKRVQK